MNKKNYVRQKLQELRNQIESKTTIVKPAKAEGATTDGSICAARNGASALGKEQARVNSRHEHKEKLKKAPKNYLKVLATKKQKDFAKSLGFSLKSGCTKIEAKEIIAAILIEKKTKKDRQKLGQR